jgi:hypothetical protein
MYRSEASMSDENGTIIVPAETVLSLRDLSQWLRYRATTEEQISRNYEKTGNGMWEIKAANADRLRRAAAVVDANADSLLPKG